jgi:tripartite-type tricarboxylate transporter receptor subunit TctC
MPKGSGGGVDVVKDLTPVIRTGFSPMVVLAHPSLGVKNLNELVAHVKQKPGLPYATSGNGSPMHIAGEVFQHATGIKMTHVPYKGVMPAVQDTVAGNVQLAISALGGVGQFISAGRLVPLAVIGPRTSLLPNVPTVQQQGITGLDVGPPWFPILAPAGTPAAIVNRLNQEVNAVLRLPDVREKLLGAGVEPQGGTVEEAQRDVREDHARYGRVVTQFNIKGE